MANIGFSNPNNPIVPDRAIVHDHESFRVQWSAFNRGNQDVPAFVDRLVVSSIPEGCPGSDDVEHEVMFDSNVDGNANDFAEPDLAAGATGPLMQPSVGPFPAGSYRLTVTLADGLAEGITTFNCINIVQAT
jgi:hypothetical protein